MNELDLLIDGATVYDGVRELPQRVSVGVRGDRIAHVGERPVAPRVGRRVDAGGLVLTPGLIDTHASTGLGYCLPDAGDNKLFQGVTTEIIGNCGTSSGPIGPQLEATMHRLAAEIGFNFTWQGLGEWIDQVEGYGLPFNSGTFVGHSTLRAGLCTDHQRVTDVEIDTMVDWLNASCSEGALGLSTGLVYAPGSFATTDEIVRLADVAARHRGLYVSHIRDERQELEASIDEAAEIGRRAEIPILVSHLKAGEEPNWGKIPRVIRQIERAREANTTISYEVYPYTAVSTKLRTFIPKAALAGGVTEMVERLRSESWRKRATSWLRDRGTDFDAMVLITESIPGAQQRSVLALARDRDRDPADMVVDLLLAEPDTWIVYHCLSELDVDAAVMWPDAIICSDSWSHPVNAPNQFGDPHPRTYGAFTRFLERWALTGRMPFGHAVRKVTSYPAVFLGLEGRGRIAPGAFADLALFDPDRIHERATFENPRQMSEGTVEVWVNGVSMLRAGRISRELPGRMLRRTAPAAAGWADRPTWSPP